MGWLDDELEKWKQSQGQPPTTNNEEMIPREQRRATQTNLVESLPKESFQGEDMFDDSNPIKNINPNYLGSDTLGNIHLYKYYAESVPYLSAEELHTEFGLGGIYEAFKNSNPDIDLNPTDFHKFMLDTPLDTFKKIRDDDLTNKYAVQFQRDVELQIAGQFGANDWKLSKDPKLDEKLQSTDYAEVVMNNLIPFIDPFDEKLSSEGASIQTEIRGDGLVTQLAGENPNAYLGIIRNSVKEYLGSEYDVMPVDLMQPNALGSESNKPTTKPNFAIVNRETGNYSFLYEDGASDDIKSFVNSLGKDYPMWGAMAADVYLGFKTRGVGFLAGMFGTGAGYSIANDLFNDYVRLPNANYTDPQGGGIQWGKAATLGTGSMVLTGLFGQLPRSQYNRNIKFSDNILASDAINIARILEDQGLDPSKMMGAGDFGAFKVPAPLMKAIEEQVKAITTTQKDKIAYTNKALKDHFNLLNIIADGKMDINTLKLDPQLFDNMFFLNEQAILATLRTQGLKNNPLSEKEGGIMLTKLVNNYKNMVKAVSDEGYKKIRSTFKSVQSDIEVGGNRLFFEMPSEIKTTVQNKINKGQYETITARPKLDKEGEPILDDAGEKVSEYVKGKINLGLFSPDDQKLIAQVFQLDSGGATVMGDVVDTASGQVPVQGLFSDNIFDSVIFLRQNLGEIIQAGRNAEGQTTALAQQATDLMSILDGAMVPENFNVMAKDGITTPLDQIQYQSVEDVTKAYRAMNQFYKYNQSVYQKAEFAKIARSEESGQLFTTTWKDMMENKSVPEQAELFDSLIYTIRRLDDTELDKIFPENMMVNLDGREIPVKEFIFGDSTALKNLTLGKGQDKVINYIQNSYVDSIVKNARVNPAKAIEQLEMIRVNDNLLFKTMFGKDRAENMFTALSSYSRSMKHLQDSIGSNMRGTEITQQGMNDFIQKGKVNDVYDLWRYAKDNNIAEGQFETYIASQYVNNKLRGIVVGTGKDSVLEFKKAVTQIDALFKEIGANPQLQEMIPPEAVQQLTGLRFVFDYFQGKSNVGTSLIKAEAASAMASPEHFNKFTGAIFDVARYNSIGWFVFGDKVSKKVVDKALKGIKTEKTIAKELWYNGLSIPAIHTSSLELSNLADHYGSASSAAFEQMNNGWDKFRQNTGLYSTDYPISEDKANFVGQSMFPPLSDKPNIRSIFEEEENGR